MSIGRILAVAGVIIGAVAVVDALSVNDEKGKPRKGKASKKNKRTIKDKRMPSKKRAFISFDYDHDVTIKEFLVGQAKHPDSPFDFSDASIKEHLTGDWKEKVRRRMDNIDVVVVLCGQHTHTANGVAAELAIAQEKSRDYFLLAAYADKICTKPSTAKETDKLYRWTWDNLKALIGGGR